MADEIPQGASCAFLILGEQKLRAYLTRRNKSYPSAQPQEPFFRNLGGKYSKSGIQQRFQLVLAHCGMAKSGRGGPRLHDLRHTFAVRRLYKWYVA